MRARIEAALRASGGNIRRTAAALGISRNTLRARMDKYGLRHRDRALHGGTLVRARDGSDAGALGLGASGTAVGWPFCA